MLIDVHVHTSISPCSVLEIDAILEISRQRGMDGVCLTDHDTMDAAGYVREGVQDDGFVVIVGMEYTTPQGDFLIFGPFENIRPGMDAQDMLPYVYGRGGAAIGAHPYRGWRPAQEFLFEQGVCSLVEGVNGRNTAPENLRAQALAHRHGLTMTGGSDAHRVDELAKFPTRFLERIESRDDLVRALLAGRCEPAWMTEPVREDLAVG
ncbi:PHP-associated domain-containing protein [Salidesulfovibrio onnuriiensis]|uniref:PHP-associated domain-containing protein n=1 Tax=Salidesulfovibrio onnuriiensis TaxID=2583823 RepID=UPI0011C92DBF|nr:PHP domain-containing protein [Salidesulfovibrio onnuriiensis]